MTDDTDLGDLLEQFCVENRINRFEGDSGLENLERVFSALGYKPHGFRFGTLIEAFLSDNPGACDAIIEWIGDQNIREWREKLEAEVEKLPGEDDDDEDDSESGDEGSDEA